MTVHDQEKILAETARLYAVFEKNGDTDRMKKARLFADKLLRNHFIIGFAGHFSAGKSTMINALTGDTLLPSSPIPTSANIVTVQKAPEDFAVVHLEGRKPVHFPSSYDFDTIKQFATSGDVSRIEIGHAGSSLPEGVSVMDTPGVDSTDDAHRLSTESSLHVADMVFYVMDYNHVQSELNFTFTKQLQDYTNLYLVVNQVDKHRDQELPFETFKQSVRESFSAWGVEPAGIFYTSLRDFEMEGNDFRKVKALVSDAIGNWEEQAGKAAEDSLRKLKDEHLEYLEEEKTERLHTFEEVLSPEEWERREEIIRESETVSRRLSVMDFGDWRADFEQKRKGILDNAVITPYEMREALTGYLEAVQPGFKVGVLFSGKKTEQERSRRKEELAMILQQTADSQIVPHLRSLMKSSLRDVRLLTDEESVRIEDLSFALPFTLVEEEIPSGAAVTGATVLNVAERIAGRIRQWFAAETDRWKDAQAPKFEGLSDEASSEMESKEFRLNQKLLAIRTLEEMEEGIALVRRSLGTAQPKETAEAEKRLEAWREELELQAEEMEEFDPSMLEQKPDEAGEAEKRTLSEQSLHDEEQVMGQAFRTAELIKDVRGFTETARYLRRKAEGLEKREFTIALFGAFSAGKSSFSNALMGDRVLPVSPNPTTAAINRIRPVREDCPHESADVHLKPEAMMLEDIRQSFEVFGVAVETLQEAYEKAPDVLKSSEAEQQVHKAFIAAFCKGYPAYSSRLGQTIRADREEFSRFVAEEERSCFVDTIDFYYDCPLTRNGVTLVDTPGADSINARHTGVAFDYIRNADAVLFITYYNHAFARADREFLIQLGRVKDAFELDKMFFIVNAIDLAASDEEAEDVKAYVRSELQRFGIRFPRLHGVSSLQALTDRDASGMAEFEEAFHHFLNDELKGMAVQALYEEERRAVERFSRLIRQTEANLSRKDARLNELKFIEQQVRIQFSASAAEPIMREASRELKELMHYVHQRVFYRFNDFFKEAYNPSVFAKKPPNEALKTALSELVGMTAFDFEQEYRATALRMVKFIEKKFRERIQEEAERLRELDPELSVTPYELEEADLPEPGHPFREADYSAANRLYRNNKDFFEKNGKEKIRKSLQDQMEPDARQYLEREAAGLDSWLSQWTEREAEGLRQHMLHQVLEAIESERILLNDEETLKDWKQRYASLTNERVLMK